MNIFELNSSDFSSKLALKFRVYPTKTRTDFTRLLRIVLQFFGGGGGQHNASSITFK